MMKWTEVDKKQLKIYTAIAFVLPYLLGLLMWYGNLHGRDTSVFPNAQMLYPAAGVMVAFLLMRKKEDVPRRFFIWYLIIAVLSVLCAVMSVLSDQGTLWRTMISVLIILGSIVGWILLLTEKKEKRIVCGLKGKNWGSSLFCIFLFLAIYILRNVIAYVLGGELEMLGQIFSDPVTWIYLLNIAINFFLSFIAFFGEEYGWRYFLQPLLQKRCGKRLGVLFLGIVWGLWHMALNFFYYAEDPSMGLISAAAQQITCITLGIFFAYAYMKTENIWVPTILHFLNNNLIMVFANNYSDTVIQGQQYYWRDLLPALILNGVLFGGFLLAKEFRKNSRDTKNDTVFSEKDLNLPID